MGTKNAKRRLRQNAGREHRFQKDVNPCLSKALVKNAVVARKALAREDLTGIRQRVTVRRANRYERQSWAFFQLRQLLTYTAAWPGVPVYRVDPRNTSRTCPKGGYCSIDNRKAHALFACTNPHLACGDTGNADHVGAINLARRAEPQGAAVNRPLAAAGNG